MRLEEAAALCSVLLTHVNCCVSRATPGVCSTAQAGVLCAAAPDESPPVRLVVVDSITASFKELETGSPQDMAHRAELLYQLAATLKQLARRCALHTCGRASSWSDPPLLW